MEGLTSSSVHLLQSCCQATLKGSPLHLFIPRGTLGIPYCRVPFEWHLHQSCCVRHSQALQLPSWPLALSTERQEEAVLEQISAVLAVTRRLLAAASVSTSIFVCKARKVETRLPGKNPNSQGARPVHQTISMIKWIRTSRLPIKNSFSVYKDTRPASACNTQHRTLRRPCTCRTLQ